MTIKVRILEDRASSTPSDQGFLKMRRLRLENTYPDGKVSEPYAYDVVDRKAMDAVVMVLHGDNPKNAADPLVLLRLALRPPLITRTTRPLPLPDPRTDPQLWELPAGLIELDEHGLDGMKACASRETKEETGYDIPTSSFEMLGASVFLSPGIIAEKIHFLHGKISDVQKRGEQTADGSAVEAHAPIEVMPLSEALRRCEAGEVEDCKTELGLRRLQALISRRAGGQ